jgi:hypothetical protein
MDEVGFRLTGMAWYGRRWFKTLSKRAIVGAALLSKLCPNKALLHKYTKRTRRMVRATIPWGCCIASLQLEKIQIKIHRKANAPSKVQNKRVLDEDRGRQHNLTKTKNIHSPTKVQ